MSEPFMSEIRIFSFTFAPKGWALCNGQPLAIGQNQNLFSLLGTTFGGNGTTTFALPDLRDRLAIHEGDGYDLGERAGAESHVLTLAQMPTHNHFVQIATSASGDPSTSPADRLLGPCNNAYESALTNDAGSNVPLNDVSMTSVGQTQAHMNVQPYLTLNFCIALSGIFPS